jgi:hypothetical protein
MKEIAFVQVWLLRALGFLTSSHKSNYGRMKKWFRTVIAMSLLSGGAICYSMKLGQNSIQFIEDTSASLLMKLLLSLNVSAPMLRPIYVLSLLLYKRSAVEAVTNDVQMFFEVSFENQIIRAKQISLRRKQSVKLFLITAALVFLQFVWYLEITKVSQLELNILADDILFPLPVRIPLWLFILLWSVFSAFCFALSQQVLVIIIMYASVIGSALKNVNTEIQECMKLGAEETSSLDLKKKIFFWKRTITNARNLCSTINENFNLILFGMYGLDFITLIGVGGNFLENRKIIQMSAWLATLALIFLSYLTVFLVPLVLMYEQVCFSGLTMTAFQSKIIIRNFRTFPEH